MKRRNPLQPMLTIEAYDSMFEEIEKLFPEGGNVDEKSISSISSQFSTLILECRNI